MESNIKRNYIKLVFLIIIFIGLALGITYAFFSLQVSSSGIEGTAGCFDVDYTGDSIKHTNLSTTTNYLEGARTVITIKKAASCKIYTKATLYIHTNDATVSSIGTANLQTGAVKYTVVNSSGSKLSEGSITTAGDKEMATNLDIPDGSAATYTIYLWVDSNLTSNHNYDGKEYSGYIFAEAIQKSTIDGS